MYTNKLKKAIGFFAHYMRRIFIHFADYYYYSTLRDKYHLPLDLRFNGTGTVIYGSGQIEIGTNTYIGQNSSIQTTEGFNIKIGNNCAISHDFTIYTSNYKANQDFSQPRSSSCGSVHIGDNCWIGKFVFIREGVTVGDNCVIGAHSMVTHDIPSNTIAAGNPCKVIKNKS